MSKAKLRGPHPPAPAKPLEPWLAGKRAARLVVLAAVVALALLPFTGKAYHVDDPLFIWAGKHIATQPLDPYGFPVNWYGYTLPMSDVTKNPPLTSYYIAAAAGLAGFGERAMHLAFLLPAIVVILGTYLLAEKLCARPLLAALFTLTTPVFLASSTTVMSDTMMLAWWILATYLWVTGLESDSWWRLAVAGLCIALSALSKYFGMTLIPLLLLYTILKRRRLDAAAAYLILPALILLAYQWGTHRLYGRGLLLDAASYATDAPNQWGRMSPGKVLVGLAFTGGCIGVAWIVALWPVRPKPWIGAAAVAIAVTLGVGATHSIGSFVLGPHDGVLGLTATFMGLFTAGGLCLLGAAIAMMAKKADAETFLLGLWILGAFAFATVINWSTNGRSILPMAPAAAILLMRWIERGAKGQPPPSWRGLTACVAAAAVLSLSVAWADMGLADSARRAARDIHAKYGGKGGKLWFEGHWGFQYYMEALGAKAIDPKTSQFVPGDFIVVPENNTNITPPPKAWTRLVETVEFPSSRGIATMNYGAGLYSDAFGPLPYAFGPVPKERYTIYEVAAPAAK
jgi:4-amino-4-deoxy-L-arabinose transferase-like glycosyltransferase